MSALALGCVELARACTRVDGGGFDDDVAVLDEPLDVGAGVGVAYFCLLSRVKPYFALADTRDARGEALL